MHCRKRCGGFLIGHVKKSPAHLHTDAIKLILAAMKKHQVKQLHSLTGGGLNDLAVDKPKFMDKYIVFLMKYLAGKNSLETLLDGIKHAKVIWASDTDWTIVRGPMLK